MVIPLLKRWVSFGCGPEKVGIARVEKVVLTFSPPTWVNICALHAQLNANHSFDRLYTSLQLIIYNEIVVGPHEVAIVNAYYRRTLR